MNQSADTWAERGARPPLPPGNSAGILLILGGGASLWDDVGRFQTLAAGLKYEVMAVNDAGKYWPGEIRHWCSLHAETLPVLLECRKFNGYRTDNIALHTRARRPPRGVCHWRLDGFEGGTSGLFAVGVALAVGYDRVVLAGMPLDGGRRFFESDWIDPPPGPAGRNLDLAWARAKHESFRDRVRSLSGRTARWLGKPTKEWLSG